MPPETLQLRYSPRVRPNRRRRPAPTARQACLRFILVLVGLAVVIGVLMKLGIIQDPYPSELYRSSLLTVS